MSNSDSIYTKERRYFLDNLGYQVYDLKFRPNNLDRILAALGELHARANTCIQMAVLGGDHTFEQICLNLKPVLQEGILALRRDGSVENRLEFGRQIEAVVPLAIRDPVANARAQAVQRYEVFE